MYYCKLTKQPITPQRKTFLRMLKTIFKTPKIGSIRIMYWSDPQFEMLFIFFLAYFHSLTLQCLYNIHPRAGKCHLHLFMVLVWIYLMPGDAEHLFMCLPAICIFSLEICLSNSFAYLLIEFFACLF